MNQKLKHPAVIIVGVFAAALIGCALGCAIANKLTRTEGHGHAGHAHHGDPSAAHVWLHETLGLHGDQIDGLEEIEIRFAKRQGELESAIAAANAKLAVALREDRAYSAQVEAAVDEIHQAQAELQKATVEHLVEMEAVLTPEQYQQLLNLAADALGG
ncbi:MAG: Spy/CpxP family protein refolding chaperone [Verrucomicrobiales bacterium]|jgi:Spy/CpxP family protein refolding chaperone